MTIKRYRISTGQGILILAITNLGAAHLYVPSFSYAVLGRSGWLLPVGAVCTAIFGGWVFARLAGRYPGRTFFDYVPEMAGPWAGRLICGVFALSLLSFVPAVTVSFSAQVSSELLIRTPEWLIRALTLLVSAYAAFHGVEALTRLTQIFSIVVVPAAVLFILMPLMLPLDAGHLLPIQIRGAAAQWPAVLAMLSAFPGFTLLGIFAPVLDPGKALRVAFWGTILPALIIIPSVLFPVMAFGWPSAARYARPFWEALAVVRISPSFPVQRLTYFLTLATRFVSYITVAAYLYAGSAGVKLAFFPHRKAYRGILLAVVPVAYASTLWLQGQTGIPFLQWAHAALTAGGLLLPACLMLFLRKREGGLP